LIKQRKVLTNKDFTSSPLFFNDLAEKDL